MSRLKVFNFYYYNLNNLEKIRFIGCVSLVKEYIDEFPNQKDKF